jgi:hypothetical protein
VLCVGRQAPCAVSLIRAAQSPSCGALEGVRGKFLQALQDNDQSAHSHQATPTAPSLTHETCVVDAVLIHDVPMSNVVQSASSLAPDRSSDGIDGSSAEFGEEKRRP